MTETALFDITSAQPLPAGRHLRGGRRPAGRGGPALPQVHLGGAREAVRRGAAQRLLEVLVATAVTAETPS